MKYPGGLVYKALVALFIGSLLVMLYGHFAGYELSIPWSVTTTADSDEFAVHQFQKGPFEFNLTGTKYSLAETFSAGPIQRDFTQDSFFLILIFSGLCVLLAGSTYLSRFWFVGIGALFIFFIINLHLPEVGLFGFGSRSSAPVIILLLVYMLPAYAFHAFYTNTPLFLRILTFVTVSTLVVVFSGVEITLLQEQLIAGSYFGLVILTLLFLLLVAEENIFAILYLVTQAKGSKNNHVHFSIFSFIYLVFMAVYYGKKSGLLNIEFAYFNPYVLLAISSLVALWSLKFKKALYDSFISLEKAQLFFCGLGLMVFAFLALAFFRGNDPVYEGLHYFIVYAHLGFGLMFFLYIILNFINPLADGLQVYKIAYREQNFPYASAKLAGMAAVAAFFFLASNEAFLLFRAGQYNYLGAQAVTENEQLLAQEYFREGSLYGYDNHFSNYQIGYWKLQQGQIDEANYHFGRAAMRYPSAQSFVNQAGTFAMKGETTPSIVSLKEGLRRFPANSQIANNLGLIYTDLGDFRQAETYFQLSEGDTKWTNANKVNYWKVNLQPETEQLTSDYAEGNLAVKTNILNQLLTRNQQVDLGFDSTEIYPSYPLHRVAFLINSSWYFKKSGVYSTLANALTGPVEENMYSSAMHAIALNQYTSGNVNMAVRSLDQLQAHAPKKEQAQYLNELGLIALEQHALPIALDYFESALQAGSDAALINKAAALMEMRKYQEAREWVEHLVTIDSSFTTLDEDLNALQARENPELEQQLSRLYYYYPEYTLAEMAALLGRADTSYTETLWKKVSMEMLKEGAYDLLQDYMALFESQLPRQHFLEAELLTALSNNRLLKNNHPISQALQLSDSSAMQSRLADIASKNAYNVPLILTVVDLLKNQDVQLAYDVLVSALAINRNSVELYKRYALTALDTGLFGYAQDALPKIKDLSSSDSYESFVKRFNARRDSIEAITSW